MLGISSRSSFLTDCWAQELTSPAAINGYTICFIVVKFHSEYVLNSTSVYFAGWLPHQLFPGSKSSERKSSRCLSSHGQRSLITCSRCFLSSSSLPGKKFYIRPPSGPSAWLCIHAEGGVYIKEATVIGFVLLINLLLN